MTAKEEAIARFIALLEKDIKYFDGMAENLEQLLPHLVGEKQKAMAKAEIAHRRAKADGLRALIGLMKAEHGE